MSQENGRPLKRVKVGTTIATQTNFAFNFRVFFGDIRDDPKPLRSPSHQDFYSLFEPDLRSPNPIDPFNQVQSVLFLTFAVSRELLFPLVSRKIPIVLASDCSTAIDTSHLEVDEKWPNFVKFFPRKKIFHFSSSSFHPKLILIRFPTFLRVVVGSGNLLEQDWIVWENVFLLKDYPMVPKAPESPLRQEISFYLDFVFQTKREFVTSFIALDLTAFDMTESKFVLVASLPGRWRIQDKEYQGLHRLKQTIADCPPAVPFSPDNITLHYFTSSVGTITNKFLLEFVSCFLSPKTPAAPLTFEEKESISKRFYVLFPSRKFVESSKFGPKSASCLFLDKDQHDSFKFQKRVLRQFQKKTEGEHLIPHIKLFLVSRAGEMVSDDTIIYLGSHNFTTAAWGRFEQDGATVFVNNYELGVLIPPLKGSAKAKGDLIAQFDVDFELKEFDKYTEPFFSRR
jgi:tyrosyl-DNA phosphodiesterase-1